MSKTLGFTGMDRNTQAELTEAFGTVIQRLGLDLRLVDNGEADAVVVDMDSLYGPMSWMQLHNAGRKVIGYTSSNRSQTDYLLPRPAAMEAIEAVLGELGATPAAPSPPPVQASPPAEPRVAAVPHGFTDAPAPMDVLPEEAAPSADDEELAPRPEPVPENDAITATRHPPETGAAGDIGAESESFSQCPSEPAPVPAREPVLADWLRPGQLQGRGRYQRGAGPAIYLDVASGQYHGPATLKPLEMYFDGQPVDPADFQPLDDAGWAQASGAGDAQPLSRLAWYAGLLEGKGALLPNVDPDGRYKLTKWLQTEREFPKHFRIATAMMKGPATVPEIAAIANVSDGEVADFVNAGLATGIVEQVLPEPPPAAEPPRGGLFGLKRGR